MPFFRRSQNSPRFVTLALCFTLCSCAWMGKPTEMDPDDCVRLVVENNNWSAMHISVECDGRHFRLGTVRSQETEAFLVKDWMLGSALKYRLRAVPVAGGTEGILTRFVPVDLEGLTHLMLEPTIWLSTVVVR